MVFNNRLSEVAEEEGLIAEEQEGFWKQRGCRDQGCVIDEQLELNDMVEEKAMAGKKA